MKSCILLILLYIFCDDFKGTNADDVETCIPSCFLKVEMAEKALCEKKEKAKKSLSFYYNSKAGNCVKSYCLKDYDRYFETEKDCNEKCKNCQRILKKYSAEDECLKSLSVQGSFKKTTGVPTPSTIFWSFDTHAGKCENIGSHFDAFEKGWSIDRGIALPTEEECNKRCPPIQ